MALKNFGLTDKEAEIYIFLAKHGVLTGGEISKQSRMKRPNIYRILKSLQKKGMVESTLEAPTRFMALPFESILESNIEAKKEEVAIIEKAKNDLLNDWKSIRKTGIEVSLEKFVVIEGRRRVYQKILQMIRKTNNQLSAILDVSDLLLVDQFGLFDVFFRKPKASKIQFRLITQLNTQNLDQLKALLQRTPDFGVNLKVGTPNLRFNLPLRMIVRDKKEVFIFTTPRSDSFSTKEGEVCLWTNCKTLVQTFDSIFEDSWNNSISIEKKIVEIETGKPTLTTDFIANLEIAQEKYYEALFSAKNEIIIVTSEKGLTEIWKGAPSLKKMNEKGVNIKLMAPITSKNFNTALEMQNFCNIRHVPQNYLKTTIIDGKHLFQFRTPESDEQSDSVHQYPRTYYSNNFEHVEKTRNILLKTWENSVIASPITIGSIITNPSMLPDVTPTRSNYKFLDKYATIKLIDHTLERRVTEQDVLNKISIFKKKKKNNKSKKIVFACGSVGHVLVHSPNIFNLPSILISAFHIDKESSFGSEDALVICLRQRTLKGNKYVSVAVIGDNPKASDSWKKSVKNTPAEKNYHLVKRDELQIQIHGKTLFVGWTIPIPLLSEKFCLPPSAMLFEAEGKIKPYAYTAIALSGVRQEVFNNSFDAFVTIMHKTTKYQVPATNGTFVRDLYIKTQPT